MRHQKKKVTLDRTSSSRKALLKLLCMSLIEHGKISTTPARAQAVRHIVEPLVTRAKLNSVANARLLERRLGNKHAASTLLRKWGVTFKSRNGGYTRMTKSQRRKGDSAEQVVLEFIKD